MPVPGDATASCAMARRHPHLRPAFGRPAPGRASPHRQRSPIRRRRKAVARTTETPTDRRRDEDPCRRRRCCRRSRALRCKGNAIRLPKAADRHRVLARKEAIIRREADLRAALHRLRHDRSAELTGDARRNRLGEENPDVTAVAGAGPFESGGHVLGVTRVDHGRCVGRPILLVEIGRQEPAGLIRQQRINASDEVGIGTPSVDRRREDVSRSSRPRRG